MKGKCFRQTRNKGKVSPVPTRQKQLFLIIFVAQENAYQDMYSAFGRQYVYASGLERCSDTGQFSIQYAKRIWGMKRKITTLPTKLTRHTSVKGNNHPVPEGGRSSKYHRKINLNEDIMNADKSVFAIITH